VFKERDACLWKHMCGVEYKAAVSHTHTHTHTHLQEERGGHHGVFKERDACLWKHMCGVEYEAAVSHICIVKARPSCRRLVFG
jgi:hypothetical protein